MTSTAEKMGQALRDWDVPDDLWGVIANVCQEADRTSLMRFRRTAEAILKEHGVTMLISWIQGYAFAVPPTPPPCDHEWVDTTLTGSRIGSRLCVECGKVQSYPLYTHPGCRAHGRTDCEECFSNAVLPDHGVRIEIDNRSPLFDPSRKDGPS